MAAEGVGEIPARRRKLGEVIAEKIMEDIEARGWPVGELIGSEAELIARYNVSRATLGEAIRQVERHGVAVMQRGGGRGLVVTSAPAAAVSRSISTYLELCDVTVGEQYEAWRLIEVRAVELAAGKLSRESCLRLRDKTREFAAVTDPTQRHLDAMRLRIAIADATENPVMGLFLRALARVLTMYVRPDLQEVGPDEATRAKSASALSDLVEAIIAGEVALAGHLVLTSLERRERISQRIGVGRPNLSPGRYQRETPEKRAQVIAMAIADDLKERNLPAGEKVGEEPELQARYGASRGVFRQAIRILETHGLVRTRRGPRGGLFVGLPSPDYTVQSAIAYLNGMQVRLTDVLAVRVDLLGNLAQLAALRGSDEHKQALAQACRQYAADDSMANRRDTIRSMYDTLGASCGNRVIELLAMILTGFVRQISGDAWPLTKEIEAFFIASAECVIDGDGALARRNMTNYLDSATRHLKPT